MCQCIDYFYLLDSVDLFNHDRCDENDIWTGHVKDPSIPRATFNTAQKMRAAMSHKFGRDYQLGTMPWVENPSIPGKYVGNPSLSVAVSQYMISLRRRKVSTGLGLIEGFFVDWPVRHALVRLSPVHGQWMSQ
jgi:hypothetical protein